MSTTVVGGQKLTTYNLDVTGPAMTLSAAGSEVYFGSRKIRRLDNNGAQIVDMADRLGSYGKYYPYGETRSTQSNAPASFATYQRDDTGLDYAVNRYYNSVSGRFMSADPYVASGGPGDPGSWNRYAYVQGDPANYIDPAGLAQCLAGSQRITYSDGSTATYLNWVECPSPPSPSPAVSQATQQMAATSVLASDDVHGSQAAQNLKSRTTALALLNKALAKALEALSLDDCRAIFGDMVDPTTGKPLDPAAILKSLANAARGVGDGGYGTISFNVPNSGAQAETAGVGLSMSWSGPYYQKVSVTFNTDYWNMGYVGEDTVSLLHELGHVMNFLGAGVGSKNSFYQYDQFSNAWNSDNTQLVHDKCTSHLKF